MTCDITVMQSLFRDFVYDKYAFMFEQYECGCSAEYDNDLNQFIEDFIQSLDNIGLGYSIRSKNYDPTTMVKDIRIKDGSFTKHTDLVEEYKLFGIHGNGSKEKTIPNFIFGLSKPLVALFLNRLFSTDGTITPIKNTNRYSVSYRTSSKKMAQSLSQLLLKFGIVARITKHESYHTNTGERVYTGTSYNINFSNNEFLKIFANEIGIFGKKNLSSLNNNPRSYINAKENIFLFFWGSSKIVKRITTALSENVNIKKINLIGINNFFIKSLKRK